MRLKVGSASKNSLGGNLSNTGSAVKKSLANAKKGVGAIANTLSRAKQAIRVGSLSNMIHSGIGNTHNNDVNSMGGKPTLKQIPAAPIAIFLSTFLLSFIAGSLIIQPQASKAVTGLGLVAAQTMTLTSSTSALNIDLTPTPTGALASGAHNLTASTNVPTGYSLTLGMTGTPTSALIATTGTVTAPIALTNNTWGYALTSSGATGASGVANGFDAAYATPTPSATSKWANPAAGSTVKRTSVSNTSGDATTVYYGARADANLTAGSYNRTVRYTATANVANIPSPSITGILPSSGTTAGGTDIEIRGTGFTVNDESVTTAVTVGGTACTGVTVSSNTPSTGQDTIYCTTPAHVAGAVNVVVTTWGGTNTEANGYTYVTPANVTFVSPSIASTTPGTESGPAFTVVGSNFTGATSVTIGGVACTSFQVVSDTQIFCEASNTINTTGAKAIAVTKVAGTGITNGTSSGSGPTSVTYNSTAYPTLQASDAFNQCSTTAKLFRDERDSQLYYVKMMADQKCWMVDNLKYANYGNLSQEGGKYLTVDGTSTQSTANSDVAKYVDPGAANYCTGTTSMPANTNTKCGLLYNWYAATRGTGTYAQSTQGTNVTGSICPANFRLPSGASDGSTATGNGTSYAAADFAVLNASMNAGSLAAGTTNNYYTNWQPSGAWGGTFSGFWYNALGDMGNGGGFWSSTVNSATVARNLYFGSSSVNPSVDPGNVSDRKWGGFAVRCVMDMTPPAGSNPSNISSTNPAILDVYPTTGWEGDNITITSNGYFTRVTDVYVGGVGCAFVVINPSLISCKLPAKANGTTNDVAVIAEGVDAVDASTYNNMKITYFDPSQSTVNIGGTTYNYYANGFTSANCSAMTPSNAAIGTEPAASLAYVRDPRNKQTYRVKKMVDNKCWMVDNLKYIDTTIANVDGTTGMVFNNDSGVYNTVDGTGAQSTANSDKAFYNNPMGSSYCSGTTNMPADTLTRCGYLYNWYAVTGGTGTYAQSTEGTNVTGNICPANFRLPSGVSDGSTATSNGTSYNAADFGVLNASMNAGTLTTPGVTTASFYAGWQPSGSWGGSFSGYWVNVLDGQGSYAYYWSSTAYSATSARGLYFVSNYVNPGNVYDAKHRGRSVRCVLP